MGVGAQPRAHQLDVPARSSWAPPWPPQPRSATLGPTLPSSAPCPQTGPPMRPCATGVSDTVGSHRWGGASGAKAAGEEPWAGVRTAERSWAGAGSGIRGRRGCPEVPAPPTEPESAWIFLGPLRQRGYVGRYAGPVLHVQEGVLTHDEALNSSQRWHPIPPTPPLGVLTSGETTRG